MEVEESKEAEDEEDENVAQHESGSDSEQEEVAEDSKLDQMNNYDDSGKAIFYLDIISFLAGQLAQLLRQCYRCERSGVRILGRSNRRQCRQRLVTASTFL